VAAAFLGIEKSEVKYNRQVQTPRRMLAKHVTWLRTKIIDTPYVCHDEDDALMCAILEMELKRRNINLTVAEINSIVNLKRSISHHLGDFWQRVLGDAPGWENLGVGDDTGCDIRNAEQNIVIELKNKMTTMNSSSKAAVMKKLQKQQELGNKAILGIVNGNGKTTIDKSTGIPVATGADLFDIVYGNRFTEVIDGVKRLWAEGDIDALAEEFMQKAMVNG
jgi:hypothetical protein